MPTFFEFFAGGGMARAGLGEGWTCLFANDFDHKKSAAYRRNWGDGPLKTCDVRKLTAEDLPGTPDLVWASFPCQDLSLAGAGAGLRGNRSGTFWPFWGIVKELISDNRAPRIVALENVIGTLHSHRGKDFEAICSTFQDAGYRFGAIIVDAALFVPHSRPRLFIIGVHSADVISTHLCTEQPSTAWHPAALCNAYDKLSSDLKKSWLWWNMPIPPKRKSVLSDMIEDDPSSVAWHTKTETKQLLGMMSDVNKKKVEEAKNQVRKTGRRMVGTIYKRTRLDKDGRKIQRAEIRFDDIAGCLRTPAGGSSRQLILVVDPTEIRSRLISTRETARLMGLPDSYALPARYNEAYHLTGDGVAVPAVRHIAENILSPLTSERSLIRKAA